MLYNEVWGLTWGWVVSWTIGFLHGIPFFLDRASDTETMVVQICVLYRHFLKNLISRKQTTIFIAKDTIGNFKVKYVFENLCLNLGLKPGERNWQPTQVFLHRESHGQRSLAGYSPWCHQGRDMTEWLTFWAWKFPHS